MDPTNKREAMIDCAVEIRIVHKLVVSNGHFNEFNSVSIWDTVATSIVDCDDR